jgi:hypothetical protein
MTQYSVKHHRRSKHRHRDHSCGFFKRGTTDRTDSSPYSRAAANQDMSLKWHLKPQIGAIRGPKLLPETGFKQGQGELRLLVTTQETRAE